MSEYWMACIYDEADNHKRGIFGHNVTHHTGELGATPTCIAVGGRCRNPRYICQYIQCVLKLAIDQPFSRENGQHSGGVMKHMRMLMANTESLKV